ncbi:MAG TPA: hypothetical protein VJZ52_02180 [Candidatus Paceibacterota bacterium]|nr:hypothetical protein [Candidatus Paceibacterota bacterium]
MKQVQIILVSSLSGLVLLGVIAFGYGVPASDRSLASNPTTAPRQFLQGGGTAIRTHSQIAYLLPLSEPNPFPLRLPGSEDFISSARAVLLFDTDNQRVIYSKNSQRQLPVASLTKLLTAMVVLDKLDPLAKVRVSAQYLNVDKTGADFRAGEVFTVNALVGALLVKSSNDAAYLLAAETEQITGEDFVGLMRLKSERLGLKHSHWLDPAGLNDEAYSSAEDLLILARQTQLYPLIGQVLVLPEIDLVAESGQRYHFISTNKLFGALDGIIGGKTGYTDGAGGCMLLEIKLPSVKSSLVAIVLGTDDRFAETKKLMEWAKVSFRWK